MLGKDNNATRRNTRGLAIITVLGPPGAGKGTLSAHMVERYCLSHLSVGDRLREWMHTNPNEPLATAIQDKLDNQGFLGPDELNPFIREALEAILNDPQGKIHGLLIDGYPRCLDQLESFDSWPFDDFLPRHHPDGTENARAPDIVLAICVNKSNARARYVGRTRDARDSAEKFEKRFVEYQTETAPVLEAYRKRDLLIELDANGTKEENIAMLERQLQESALWGQLML